MSVHCRVISYSPFLFTIFLGGTMVDLSHGLVSELQSLVDKAIENGETVNSISTKAHRAHTTLRRILTNEVGYCQLETIRSFIEVLAHPSEQHRILSKYFPEEYGAYQNQIAKIQDFEAVEFFLQNIVTFQIYVASEQGFSRDQIVKVASICADKYINIALEKKWLKEDKGLSLIRRNGPELEFRADDSVKAVGLASQFLQLAGITRPGHITYMQQLLTPEQTQLIKNKMTEIFNILEDAQKNNSMLNSNCLPVFVGLVLGAIHL